LFLLWRRAIVDDVGDHAMPKHSVSQRPDELCWNHVVLSRCTQTIQILPSSSLIFFTVRDIRLL